jgi:hypothetical protein
MAFTPALGVKGRYALIEPFNNDLLPNVLYNCESVRSLAEIAADGTDPYTKYYQPKELTREQYQKDVDAGVQIVTFRADSGNWASVPSSYISGAPNSGGVPYRTMMMVAYLAPIPDSLDLSFLQTKMGDLVFDTLGVRANIVPVVTSPPTVLDYTEHDAIEASRQQVIAANQTDYAKYLSAANQLQAAQQQIAILEDYIAKNGIKPA